jgi:hypothetical protein
VALGSKEVLVNRWLAVLALVSLVTCAATCAAEGAGSRLGVGLHYWTAVNKIPGHDIDKNGFSWVGSFQFNSESLIKLETDLEVFPSRFAGSDKTAFAPQAYVLVGKAIYGGMGIGIYYNGKFADNPFYALRAGMAFELVPSIYFDVNANYRWETWNGLGKAVKGIKPDTITLGAGIQMAF